MLFSELSFGERMRLDALVVQLLPFNAVEL